LALATGGCVDGNLARRDDGRYAVMSAPGATAATRADAGQSVPVLTPGRAVPVSEASQSQLTTTETPRERARREAQDQLETDLAALDKK